MENVSMEKDGHRQEGSEKVKRGLAQMLKGGVIMDVVTPEHAVIAEEAGAVAVMALERVPADIRADGARRAHRGEAGSDCGTAGPREAPDRSETRDAAPVCHGRAR